MTEYITNWLNNYLSKTLEWDYDISDNGNFVLWFKMYHSQFIKLIQTGKIDYPLEMSHPDKYDITITFDDSNYVKIIKDFDQPIFMEKIADLEYINCFISLLKEQLST